MTYQDYLQNEQNRKKYQRKKSYLNLETRLNGFWVLAHYSAYGCFFITVSTDRCDNFYYDEKPSIFSTKEQIKKVKSILESQIQLMKQEEFKSCTGSTFHYNISSNNCSRVQWQGEEGFTIDHILGYDISSNEHVFQSEKEHNSRILEVEKIFNKVFIN